MSDRHDMVERELACGEGFAAVLTAVVVARVDVRAGEGNVVESAFDFDVAKQSDDGGQFEADGDAVDLPVVHRDNLDLSLAPQRHRLLPVDDLEGLVRRVQEKRLFHVTASCSLRLLAEELVVILPDRCRGVKAMTPVNTEVISV